MINPKILLYNYLNVDTDLNIPTQINILLNYWRHKSCDNAIKKY